jgi:hypothetical protein
MTKSLQLGGGRPRKPTAHKALAGTLRPSRANPAEPQLRAMPIPSPPRDLTKFERLAWRALKEIVDPMKVGTAADVFAFRSMVEDAGMLASLRKSFIDSGGQPVYVEETNAGPQLRMRPEVQAIPTYRKLLLLHMARWGIDPADRQKVMTLGDDGPKVDPLAKFRLGGPK